MPATCLNNFDITLLFSLIRDLHPKTSDVPEPKSDVWNNLQAARSSPDLPRQILDLIEIKFYRNSLAHSKSVNITDSDYELMWQSITISVLNLGVTTEQLDSVKNITIDPEKEQEYITQLKNQEQEEQNLKEGLHTRIRRVEHAVTVIVVLVVAASMGMVLRDKLPKSILGLIDMLQFGFSDPSTVQIVSRREWGAREASGPMSPLLIPVKYVIIAHTVSGLCESVEACSGILRGIQQRHMADRGWSDIAYNYHIADDGRVYEGRGPSIAGSHTKGWNLNSWGIAFMGDFSYRLPSPRALWALKAFLKNSVENGFLEENYVLLGHCQVAPFASPGDTLYRELKTWDHWQDIHA
ncbi:peptidoglycan recognition protein 1 [Lingula anatina]|uniref:Peptidoglycan recognition protein 1 n=1 Tax=Lingula anatina TaxID=7574 RepID=A0A1S3IS40_LINAN|nr:peptidoglycan recognition protein 1 [Lingula anatina]|eukprot:XP_013400756.1 peptidoglycan recognition protein 1 [Lingula anatina]